MFAYVRKKQYLCRKIDKTMKKLFTCIALCLCVAGYAATITGTLPVVYINTANGQAIDSKETYLTATIRIDPLQTGYAALGSEAVPVTAMVKGRGNWTWSGFDKKPYRIKFDAKQAVLGMPKNRHWVLLAEADDHLGCLKNPAGFMLSEAIGLRWTPRLVPVELVLNGAYQGLYFLTEHVRVGSKRVNIEELPDNTVAADSITGGWIVEIDNYSTENNITFNEGNGQWVMVSLKEPEILSPAQRRYLEQQISALNTALYDYRSTLSSLLDFDEAAKYYLVQELMEDCESYHGSCFLYKDRDSLGVADPWKFGPVWDFGNAYDRHEERWIYDRPTWPQYWIGQLATWPEFQKKVKEQWYVFYHEHKDEVRAAIRTFADRIETAAKNDAEVWRGTQNYCDNSNYTDVRDRFFRRYDWRIGWLYNQWGEGIKPVTEDVEEVVSRQPSDVSRKVLRNGQLYILRGDKLYTITGQIVK